MISAGSDFDKRYSLLEELGKGGMSVVFKARDKFMEREVALKIINPNGTASGKEQERFKRECQTLSGLSHPNIVKLLSSGIEESGKPYLVMELLSGRTLESVIAANEKIDSEKFASIFLPLTEALILAHDQKIIHRDLKPANIMLVKQEDGTEIPKILDFGIAKILHEEPGGKSSDATVGILGSPLYMSPEQARGAPLDHRADIYSLACVMYHVLTGRPPFEGETPLETMYEHMRKSIPSLSNIRAGVKISPALVDLITKSLSKNPDERPLSMHEFRESLLLALQSGHEIESRVSIAGPYVLAVLLVLVLAAAGFLMKKAFDASSIAGAAVSTAQSKKLVALGSKTTLARAEEMSKSGRHLEAIILYREVLKTLPAEALKKKIDIHNTIAARLRELKRYGEAAAEFKTVISMYPDPVNTSAAHVIGDYVGCLLSDGQSAKAEDEYKRYIKGFAERLAGSHSVSLAYLYEQYAYFKNERGVPKEAVSLAEKALKEFELSGDSLEPYAVDAAFVAYDASLALGDRSKAVAILTKKKQELESAALERPNSIINYKKELSSALSSEHNPSGASREFALQAEQRGDYNLAQEMNELSMKQARYLSLKSSNQFMKEYKEISSRLMNMLAANPKNQRHLLVL